MLCRESARLGGRNTTAREVAVEQKMHSFKVSNCIYKMNDIQVISSHSRLCCSLCPSDIQFIPFASLLCAPRSSQNAIMTPRRAVTDDSLFERGDESEGGKRVGLSFT